MIRTNGAISDFTIIIPLHNVSVRNRSRDIQVVTSTGDVIKKVASNFNKEIYFSD